jgi:predicted dehydrogenase
VVRYGFIGTGTQGCTLLRFLATIPEGRCVATCDIYPPNLKKGVETIGAKTDTYEDYRRLLDRKDIEAVMIATPLYLHARMTIDALNAGKHVFIEKSMFFKEEEGEQIREAAAAHPKQVLQVGLHRRSSVLHQVAGEMVRKGALGKVLLVQSRITSNGSWRRPVADAKYERLINWRMYREYSGGLMAEMGSHYIDIANWMFDAEPVSVIGTGGLDYWKDGREVHDNVQAIFDYPGGRRHYCDSMLFNSHRSNGVMIMGDQGTLDINDDRGIYFHESVAKVSTGPAKENWWAGATASKAAAQKGIPIIPQKEAKDSGFVDQELGYAKRWLASMGIYQPEEPYDPYWGELVNFFASIREGKPVIAPVEIGFVDSMAVIYANRAIDAGKKACWPKK